MTSELDNSLYQPLLQAEGEKDSTGIDSIFKVSKASLK